MNQNLYHESTCTHPRREGTQKHTHTHASTHNTLIHLNHQPPNPHPSSTPQKHQRAQHDHMPIPLQNPTQLERLVPRRNHKRTRRIIQHKERNQGGHEIVDEFVRSVGGRG